MRKLGSNKLLSIAVSLVFVIGMTSCGGGEPIVDGGGGGGGTPTPGTISPSTKKPSGTAGALSKGLSFLNSANWTTVSYARPQGPVVLASFIGLALLAEGGGFSGTYGGTIKDAADYVAAHIMDPNTASPEWDQTNWNLSIGALFLAEAYSSSGDSNYLSKAVTACSKLGSNRESSGGYGHGPGGNPNPLGYCEIAIMSDWVVMAMGATDQAGGSVSNSNLSAAANYLKQCTVSYNNNIGYSHSNSAPGIHRTGSGVMAFHIAGINDGITNTWLQSIQAGWNNTSKGHGSAAMGWLGVALGCMCGGQSMWDSYVQDFFPTILNNQKSNGSWNIFQGDGSGDALGETYTAAVMCLILQLDLGNLFYLKY